MLTEKKLTPEEIDSIRFGVRERIRDMSYNDLVEEAEENLFQDLIRWDKDDLVEAGWL